MRIGNNPRKSTATISTDFYHQVVVPVYIPNLEDYYAQSHQILKICLKTLIASSHSKTFITIVNNGSCQEVLHYLDQLYSEGQIHELIHTSNIGKVNAIYKGITGHSFPLITISDADVLFLKGWQKATYDVLESIPQAGAVCTTPLSRNIKYLTSNILFDYFFSKSLAFTDVKNPVAMQQFAVSIGKNKFLRQSHLEKYLTVTKNGTRAVVGAGHYVCTYRGDIFAKNRFSHSEEFMGKTVRKHLDLPVLKKNYWRLSTEENYTYHMGNGLEDWMVDMSIEKNNDNLQQPKLQKRGSSLLSFWIKTNIFSQIIYIPFLLRKFLWYKGLPRKVANHY